MTRPSPTVVAMSIIPTLRYDDPKAAIDFLVTALGFTEKNVMTADDGTIGHAELAWGPADDEGVIMLGTRTGGSPFDTGKACQSPVFATNRDPVVGLGDHRGLAGDGVAHHRE